MKKIFGMIGSLAVLGCTSSRGTLPVQPEFFASSVIERIGGAEKTPAWTVGDVPLVEEGNNMLYAYTIIMAGGSRTDSCVNAAELKAKSQIVQYIKISITESGQLNENANQDNSSYEGLTAFLSSGKLSSVKLVARYWEKVQESNQYGNRTMKLRCAARVSITRAELTKQLEDAVEKAKVSQEMKAKLQQAQQKFIESVAKENDDEGEEE
jgi:hypothetical protein